MPWSIISWSMSTRIFVEDAVPNLSLGQIHWDNPNLVLYDHIGGAMFPFKKLHRNCIEILRPPIFLASMVLRLAASPLFLWKLEIWSIETRLLRSRPRVKCRWGRGPKISRCNKNDQKCNMGTKNSWTFLNHWCFSHGVPSMFGYQWASFRFLSASQQHIHDSRQCRDASCVHLALLRLSHSGSISNQDTWRLSWDPKTQITRKVYIGIETHWDEICARNSSITSGDSKYLLLKCFESFYRHSLDSNNSSKRQRSARTLETQTLANPPVPIQSVASKCGRKQDVAASAPVRDQTNKNITPPRKREKTKWRTLEQILKSGSLEGRYHVWCTPNCPIDIRVGKGFDDDVQ